MTAWLTEDFIQFFGGAGFVAAGIAFLFAAPDRPGRFPWYFFSGFSFMQGMIMIGRTNPLAAILSPFFTVPHLALEFFSYLILLSLAATKPGVEAPEHPGPGTILSEKGPIRSLLLFLALSFAAYPALLLWDETMGSSVLPFLGLIGSAIGAVHLFFQAPGSLAPLFLCTGGLMVVHSATLFHPQAIGPSLSHSPFFVLAVRGLAGCALALTTWFSVRLRQRPRASVAGFSEIGARWGAVDGGVEPAASRIRMAFSLGIPVIVAFMTISGYFLIRELDSKSMIREAERSEGHFSGLRQGLEAIIRQTNAFSQVLGTSRWIPAALVGSNPEAIDGANLVLDRFAQGNPGAVAYLMNRDGLVLASSNRHAPDSFLGNNYSFRPYFRDALAGGTGGMLARGVTSKLFGYYSAYPVRSENREILGVVALKAPLEPLRSALPFHPQIALFDQEGIVVLSNFDRPDWANLMEFVKTTDSQCSFQIPSETGEGFVNFNFHFPKATGGRGPRHAGLIFHAVLKDWNWTFLLVDDPVFHLRQRLQGFLLLLLLIAVTVGSGLWIESFGWWQRKTRSFERLFKSLTESLPSTVLFLDPEGGILKSNDLPPLGGFLREIPSKDIRTLPWDRPSEMNIRRLWEGFLEGNHAATLVKLAPPTWNQRTFEFSLHPIRDGSGRISEAIGIFTDVTHHRQTSLDLRRELSFTRCLLETARFIIIVFDRNGRVVRGNPFLEEISGVSEGELGGRDWVDLILREADRETFRKALAQAGSGTRVESLACPIIDWNRRERIVEWALSPLSDSPEVVSGVLAVGKEPIDKLSEHALYEKKNARREAMNSCFLSFGIHSPTNISLLIRASAKIIGADQACYWRLENGGNARLVFLLKGDSSAVPIQAAAAFFGNRELEKGIREASFLSRSDSPQWWEKDFALLRIAPESVMVVPIWNGPKPEGWVYFHFSGKDGAGERRSERGARSVPGQAAGAFPGYRGQGPDFDPDDLDLAMFMGSVVGIEEGRRAALEHLARTIRELSSREKQNDAELEIARTVHRSLLPSEFPPISGFSFGLAFQPCFKVGGDFFQILPFSNPERLGILFADISGHGVAGAMLAFMFKVHAQAVFMKISNPIEAFMEMNKRLSDDFPAGFFASLFYLTIEAGSPRLRLVSASPERPLIIGPAGSIEVLSGGGPPLGLLPPEAVSRGDFTVQEFPFPVGATLLMYTDGLPDIALDPQRRKRLGMEGLLGLAAGNHGLPPQELADTLFSKATELAAADGIADDIMILTVRNSGIPNS